MPLWFNKLRRFDLPLLLSSGLLLVIGLTVIYATSLSSPTMEIFYRQLVFAGLAVVAFLVVSYYNYHNLAKLNRLLYPLLLVSLLFIKLFGREIRGSSRWIDLGFFNFQPAEFAKIIIILGLARWLYLKRGEINSWKSIAVTFVYTFAPAALIIWQPDLGSALILLFIWGGILLLSSISKKFLVSIMLIALVFAGLGWQFVLKDYQKQRVETFLNPSLDPQGQGYNSRQAVIAVGSGGVTGRGLGRGLQSQLRFLPERQTDFIFASAAEEVGFIGSVLILGLYGFILFRIVRVMTNAKDSLGRYLCGGVFFLLFSQTAINVGMNLGLLPVTGIPLPFLTYGGSSLVVCAIALGIVQSVARQSQALRF